MGKDSLIKSTSKKKTATKKTDEKKKTAAAKKAAVKKAPTKKAGGKKAAKKTVARKKAAPKKKAAVRKTAVQKKAAPKKAASRKKTAPKKTARKKTVSKTVVRKKAVPKKTPAKKLTIRELLNLKFEWPQSGKMFKPATAKTKFPEPPPLISSTDEKEARRIRAVLMRSYNMEKIREAGRKTAAGSTVVDKAAEEKTAAGKITASRDIPAAACVPPSPPVDRTGQYLTFGSLGIAILLFLLVISASMNNTGTYYIRPAEGAVEIWQGKFAPLGKKLLVTLPGVPAPEEIMSCYEKKDVFPLVYNYYLDKADALLAEPGFPDFGEIKKYLEKALKFAHTNDLKSSVYARIDGIDIAIFMYKADVAASRATREDLKIALAYLDSAAALNPDEDLLKLIEQKRTLFDESAAAIEAQAAEETRAAEEALTAQEETKAEEGGQQADREPGPAADQQTEAPDH